eukprot:Skav234862  [mRNA]  locus=scaffold840:199430:213158:- [translate_table: standard]
MSLSPSPSKRQCLGKLLAYDRRLAQDPDSRRGEDEGSNSTSSERLEVQEPTALDHGALVPPISQRAAAYALHVQPALDAFWALEPGTGPGRGIATNGDTCKLRPDPDAEVHGSVGMWECGNVPLVVGSDTDKAGWCEGKEGRFAAAVALPAGAGGAAMSHGNELSQRELERQLQELRRDKVKIDDNIRRMEAVQKRIFGDEERLKLTALHSQTDGNKEKKEDDEEEDGEEKEEKKEEKEEKENDDPEKKEQEVSRKRKREEDAVSWLQR